MNITVEIVVEAPPATVWDTIEPIEHHVDWMADAEAIRFTSASQRGVGTTFDCVTKLGPFRLTDRMAVTEWSPPRAMGIEHEGAVRGRGRFTIDAVGDTRSRFTWSEALTFPWWLGGAVGATLARPALVAVWRRNLTRLKRLVETAPDSETR